MTRSDLIRPNPDGTYTVAGMATVLTEADALALLSEPAKTTPTTTPVCAMNATKLSHRWERVA